jgi:hypothetical protein
MSPAFALWIPVFSAVIGASGDAEEIRAFHGSTEHGLVLARAKIRAGRQKLRLKRFAAAARDLQEGGTGLEDAFDRLAGLDEILQAWLLLADAELQARHRVEAERAAEAVARLYADRLPATGAKSSALRVLLEEAARRVSHGARGTLRITSVVKGQAVYLDGRPQGRTPERLELPVGRHFVLVETPLGQIPYRVDLPEGASLSVGQGDTDEVCPEISDVPDELGQAPRAARRPVLPRRR